MGGASDDTTGGDSHDRVGVPLCDRPSWVALRTSAPLRAARANSEQNTPRSTPSMTIVCTLSGSKGLGNLIVVFFFDNFLCFYIYISINFSRYVYAQMYETNKYN